MEQIRQLQRHEHNLIGDIIADGFASDPVNQWVFGGYEGIKAYNCLMAKKLYLKSGYGDVMDDESGGALWLPPGVSKEIPLWNSIDIASSMLRFSGPCSIRRGMAVDNFLANKKPKTPHYYLYAIAARSGMQGKGIGGRLMQAGLERVDSESMPAYLESSKELNFPFYRRCGFEVLEEVVPAPGCPPLWLMWRDAVGSK